LSTPNLSRRNCPRRICPYVPFQFLVWTEPDAPTVAF
jgi:hypothetical protein